MEQQESWFAQHQCGQLVGWANYRASIHHAAHGVRHTHYVLRAGLWLFLLVSLSVLTLAQTQTGVAEHARRAAEAIRTNQAAHAIQELEAWLRLEPKNATARANLGMVYFTQEEYGKAAQEFKNALAVSPSLWNAKVFLGMCQLHLGAADDGQRLIGSSLDHISNSHLRNQAGLELIRSYVDAGEPRKAVPIVNLLEDRDPTDAEVEYSAYQLYSALAARALEQLSSIGEDSARIHQVLAQLFMTQEKYPQAIQEYVKAIKRNPHLPGLYLGKGEAELAAGATEENRRQAANDFNAELAINPGSADAAFQLGQLRYGASDLNGASQFLMRAMALRPTFTEAHIAMGLVLARMGNEDAALAEFELAAKQDPNNRMAHYHLSQLYKKHGRTEEADRELKLFRRLSESQNAKKPSVEIDQLPEK